MYRIVQKKSIWLSIAIISTVLAVTFLAIWGLKFGIDFTGGSLLEIKFLTTRPEVSQVYQAAEPLNLGSLTVQPVGEKQMIFRFQETSEEKHQTLLAKLNELTLQLDSQNSFEELRFDSVGPSVGQDLKTKSVYAITVALIAIIIYIALAFYKVSKPVASWKYGVAAVVAMFHDVLFTLGIFSVLGKFYGVEINTAFVAALLTVVGYSVHDTIVVFDRIRENLPRSDENFEDTVNTSINQTLVRSINTSLTVILVLLSIVIFGGPSIRNFALALTVGIFVGTYSSIFIASPMIVIWEKFKK